MDKSKQTGKEICRLLVVDDDRMILEMLSAGLQHAGYQVLLASSGEDGLRMALDHNPDLAILDIEMPRMSGIDLATRLQRETCVPFLFLSSHDDGKFVQQATECGAVGYIVKPIGIPQLVPSIQAALARAAEISRLRQTESELTLALAAGRDTNVAIGMLMERFSLTRSAAFEALRKHARTQQRKIQDVAAELIQAADTLNLLGQDALKK